ncbi:chondroitinase-B domain-containing protein [Rhodoferax sp.]|uniref:chondroitinase-B domain-containing protein n=1 Tax=Rhodoferax sp. TaxID=50421 RepID=UPI00284231F1|nr:chondroitinase-B domain-containing protein [Rhodoferax sp.]MDR3368495.1 chondroitinase-B domain-containing protein [Rhodoferax sp.]
MAVIRKILKILSIGLTLLVFAMGGLWLKNRDSLSPDIWQHAQRVVLGQEPLLADRTPGELIRYALRRLEGHPNLEAVLIPPLHWTQTKYEHPVPPGPMPTLGKGQLDQAPPPLLGQAMQPTFTVNSASEIIRAISSSSAKAGQTVLIAPGHYRINQNIKTAVAGNAQQLITVRASRPGQVVIELNAQEGFIVSHPYWVFENLDIRGVCRDDSSCEHAFHVVGQGAHLVVRNNRIEDFNAPLKINGLNGDWPDDGLLQHNTVTNSRARTTQNPTTMFDLVGANNWQVLDNVVSNFVKNGGNGISYGVFMKGASSGGRIERNLVICTLQNVSQPGLRVGISFGGGTTGKDYCRDGRCTVEHAAGLAANNIVAHCNDSGIDVNMSTGIVIAHNTLVNTAGIDVRQAPASAKLYGNLLEGKISLRKGGQAKLVMNEIVVMADVFEDANALKLGWRRVPPNIPTVALVPHDFYDRARGNATPPGALSGIE